MQDSFSGMQKVALGLGALCVFGAAPAPAAETAARVTAAVGSTSSEGSAVDPRGGLQDGDDLETGEDGNCSLLVDEDALVEVCGNTSLRLERKDEPGVRFTEMIELSDDGRSRARTWQWFRDGVPFKRTLCDEWRIE